MDGAYKSEPVLTVLSEETMPTSHPITVNSVFAFSAYLIYFCVVIVIYFIYDKVTD